MPKVILAFDVHDRNSAGRTAFEDELKARCWVNFYVMNETYYKLPETTFLSNKSVEQVRDDLENATAKGVKKDTSFKLTRYISSEYKDGYLIKDISKRSATAEEKAQFKKCVLS